MQEVENVNEKEQEEEEEEEETKETEISQQSTLTPPKMDTKVIVSLVNPIWPVFYCCVKNYILGPMFHVVLCGRQGAGPTYTLIHLKHSFNPENKLFMGNNLYKINQNLQTQN